MDETRLKKGKPRMFASVRIVVPPPDKAHATAKDYQRAEAKRTMRMELAITRKEVSQW